MPINMDWTLYGTVFEEISDSAASFLFPFLDENMTTAADPKQATLARRLVTSAPLGTGRPEKTSRNVVANERSDETLNNMITTFIFKSIRYGSGKCHF
jgi:hypothetical protein